MWCTKSNTKDRPPVNHIWFYDTEGEWVTRTFPMLDEARVIWAEDVKCPESCKLAFQCHPMVRDGKDENLFHKLCTLSAIKNKIISRSEILGSEEGSD